MVDKKQMVDAYLGTIDRFEPEISMVDVAATAASIAISLKRIADQQEQLVAIQNMMLTIMGERR